MMIFAGALIWAVAACMYCVGRICDAYQNVNHVWSYSHAAFIWPGIVGTVVVALGILKEFRRSSLKAPTPKDN